jgi:hypothetical protein
VEGDSSGWAASRWHINRSPRLPETHATVRRIQVAAQECHLSGGAFRAVAGTVRLREVTKVPTAFSDKPVTHDTRIIEIGVLCDIETDGAP